MQSLTIGRELKSLRQSRGLTLDELAALTGVSKPMLGQIERGQSSPTINTLWKIATGLKAPLSLLLREREGGFVTVIPSDLIMEESGSMRAYTLFPFDPIRSFEAFVIEFEAGCIHQSDAHAENVEETVFVISGKLDITVNGHAETLSDGQAARFRADAPHIYGNPYSELCRIYNTIFY